MENDQPLIDAALGDKLHILFRAITAHSLQHKIVEVFNEICRRNINMIYGNGKPT